MSISGVVLEPITAIDLSSEEEVRARVVVLRDRMTRDYLEMGRLLYHICDKRLYLKWTDKNGRSLDASVDGAGPVDRGGVHLPDAVRLAVVSDWSLVYSPQRSSGR